LVSSAYSLPTDTDFNVRGRLKFLATLTRHRALMMKMQPSLERALRHKKIPKAK